MPDETQDQSTEKLESPADGATPEPAELPAGETGSDEPETTTEG